MAPADIKIFLSCLCAEYRMFQFSVVLEKYNLPFTIYFLGNIFVMLYNSSADSDKYCHLEKEWFVCIFIFDFIFREAGQTSHYTRLIGSPSYWKTTCPEYISIIKYKLKALLFLQADVFSEVQNLKLLPMLGIKSEQLF